MQRSKDHESGGIFRQILICAGPNNEYRAVRTMTRMPRNAKGILDEQFLEMRWRALSLAADLDRIERAPGGKELLATDPRLATLREAIKTLLQTEPERAAKVQMIFSDMTPPPPRNGKS